MWPSLSGVEGIFPLGGLPTSATAGAIAGTEVAATAPTVIPRLFRKRLRSSCCCVMDRPPVGGSGANAPAMLGARTPAFFSGLLQHLRPSGPSSKSNFLLLRAQSRTGDVGTNRVATP